jgi:FixJ family two-component response regulator
LEVQVISVVDDDSSVRAATDNLLSSHGYEVRTFVSAEAFLQSASQDNSSCIVADVQMPGMSGLDLLASIRSSGNLTPFIFITAFPDPGMRMRAMKLGAADFLEKPFPCSMLINCIEAVLKQK